ncbi:MAG TPA: glycogen synthase GlgA [Terracidiphilus sp.]|nr:glycogen synthase GlgA [Terracidiphilus sp.]
MQISFAASEATPFAKTGGLADVAGALPRELVKLGHSVTVFLPFYSRVRKFVGDEPKYAIQSVTIPFRHYNRFVGVVDAGLRDGVQHYFIDCPELFDRKELYGTAGDEYSDNAERFGLFCRAVIEASKQLGVPDVFHVHDWQAALIPVYLKTVYATDPALSRAASVLTIHNAAYQGQFPPTTTEDLLLPWDVFTMDKLEQYDRFNFLKGGVVFSDMLTTVSKKYAEEIKTPEFGEHLEGVIRKRAADLRGILNGVDYAQWDPAKDGYLAAHYSAKKLEGKRACRADLLHAFGLDNVAETTPVIGIVSRFAKQKGFDILAAITEQIAERDVALVALGTHDPYYENLFRSWAFRYPANIAVQIRYDEALAHKVEAGADIFLMPSRYEPCGLNQIYSLKYGTVPIVRATGGLDDTIEEWDAKKGKGTGFKFAGYDPEDLLAEIDRAIAAFRDKKSWTRLMRNGMARDYSWTGPAKEYVKVYEEAVRKTGT